ncbi:hypothetical protein [Pantoea vagans]|uniref:hypothetical protein n=1 Tax=Pantoea vagans TaxID=470934 RepID=UPI003FA38502
MIIIHLHFDGGSAEEEHDIAHIASSIVARLYGGLFFVICGGSGSEGGVTEQSAYRVNASLKMITGVRKSGFIRTHLIQSGAGSQKVLTERRGDLKRRELRMRYRVWAL